MNRNVKKYLNDVKMLFPVYQKEERVYLKRMKESLLKETDTDHLTYEQCVERFGQPMDVINSYCDEMDSQEFIDKVRKQRQIKKTVISIGIICVLCVISVSLWKSYLIYKDAVESMNQRVTEVEISAPVVISEEKIDD